MSLVTSHSEAEREKKTEEKGKRGGETWRGQERRERSPQLPNTMLVFHLDCDCMHHMPNRGLLVCIHQYHHLPMELREGAKWV